MEKHLKKWGYTMITVIDSLMGSGKTSWAIKPYVSLHVFFN